MADCHDIARSRAQVLHQLDNFINVFRKEIGRDEYTRSTAQQQVDTFLANLKKQVDAYMQEAKQEMRDAGFPSTPWDNMGGQQS